MRRWVRERTGHALIGARQWIPREHIEDPVKSLAAGLPPGPGSSGPRGSSPWASAPTPTRTGCPSTSPAGTRSMAPARKLREFFEDNGQAYVLRVACNFAVTLAPGTKDDRQGGGQEAAEGQAIPTICRRDDPGEARADASHRSLRGQRPNTVPARTRTTSS